MGARLEIQCPVDSCPYHVTFRLPMGDEASGAARAERAAILRDEHPNHPAEQADDQPEPFPDSN